jgi:hypothetical protein
LAVARGEQAPDGRIYGGLRPDELARLCVADAVRDGFDLDLRPYTPVIPDEHFAQLTERTTWAEIEALVRHLSDIGCSWVNLRFAIEEDGSALVRYEANPSGAPNDGGWIPACNGGFDAHRLMSYEEFRLRYPLPPHDESDDEGFETIEPRHPL